MDGTSPGNMPTSLGNVWVGEVRPAFVATTACNNTPYRYPLTAEPMNGATVVGTTVIVDVPPVGAQSCIVEPWPWPTHPVVPLAPVLAPVLVPTPQSTYHYHFAAPLSDADVERIARRVVELLQTGANKQAGAFTKECGNGPDLNGLPIK